MTGQTQEMFCGWPKEQGSTQMSYHVKTKVAFPCALLFVVILWQVRYDATNRHELKDVYFARFVFHLVSTELVTHSIHATITCHNSVSVTYLTQIQPILLQFYTCIILSLILCMDLFLCSKKTVHSTKYMWNEISLAPISLFT